MHSSNLLFSDTADQKVEASLLVEWNSRVVCGQHRMWSPHPNLHQSNQPLLLQGDDGGAGGSGGRGRGRGKKSRHNPIWRPCALVTLLHCACALWFCQQRRGSFEEAQVASRWPTKQPSRHKNRRNSPRLSLSLTDKLLQSWHDDIAKALGLSLNGTGRIHGRQFPVGSWYHSEPVLSSSPT